MFSSGLEKKIYSKAIKFAQKKMQDLKPSHSFDHAERVSYLAERIALAENADLYIVKVSAILHDIGRDIEDTSKGKICHAVSGSKIAYEFLLKNGLDDSLSERISLCIREHRFRGNHKPSSLESEILYDADKLDSVGAIGIGRAFLFAGEVGAKVHLPDVDVISKPAYSDYDTAYREYLVKLKHLKGKMLTREGKRIAKERSQFMDNFFERLDKEARGEV